MTSNVQTANGSPLADRAVIKKVAISSFLGNFIEWFDFATYLYFAVTLGIVFFPDAGASGTLMTFAVFAISFLMRPLGAIFWGSLGDKKGRKWALSVSIFLMSGAAFLIGCLPSFAVAGWFAPIALLVLRTLQGFSAAGEYSGAAVFLAEYAPNNKRGKYCSLVPTSTATGLLVGSTVALIAKATLGEADMLAWGWRIPFLIAGPLGLIAHWIRTTLEDAPVYKNAAVRDRSDKPAANQPLMKVIKEHPKSLLCSIAATMVNSIGFYVVLTFLPTYLTQYAGMDAAAAQAATDITLLCYILLLFATSWLSDHVGRRKMLLAACALFIVLSIPAWFLVQQVESFALVMAGELILCVCMACNDGTIACYQAELFPTDVRYTGAALGSNIGYAIFGGTASMVCTFLIDSTGNMYSAGIYMIVICVIAGIVQFKLAKEYAGKDMGHVGE